jgi:membrane-bound serine protease (ClpP class)
VTLAIVLLTLGLILIIAEVLVPSFGLLGGLATLSIIGSVIVAWQEDPALGSGFLVAAVLLVPTFVVLAFKILPRTPLGKRLILSGPSFEDGAAVDQRDKGLVGVEGFAMTPLRPAGMAQLGGRRVDVVSRGERIDQGVRVRVIEVRGNRVVVMRLREEGPVVGPE